jgi:hypothetical protein
MKTTSVTNQPRVLLALFRGTLWLGKEQHLYVALALSLGVPDASGLGLESWACGHWALKAKDFLLETLSAIRPATSSQGYNCEHRVSGPPALSPSCGWAAFWSAPSSWGCSSFASSALSAWCPLRTPSPSLALALRCLTFSACEESSQSLLLTL